MNTLNIILLAFLAFSCTNYHSYPTFSENDNPFMVVEVPAGTNLKYEYDADKNKFILEQIDNEPRSVAYLPYPANYGFIPSTLMDEDQGGDGDPLDVLGIGSNIKQGNILEFVPVGVLLLKDNGEADHKILGLIINSEVSIRIDCSSLKCLQEQYPGILKIIETWFLEYKREGNIEVLGWRDEQHAREIISKWQVE